jgi:hypothetical protein
MASLRLVVSAVKGQFTDAIQAMYQPIAVAATAAIHDAGALVLRDGRAAIASGGFGPKWQRTLKVNYYPGRAVSAKPALLAYHKIPYAGVFETGARIGGSPLLWLPLGSLPAKIGGRRMTPRNYAAAVGPLHSIRAPGRRPMLAGYMPLGKRGPGKITLPKLRAGARASRNGRTAGLVSVPLFVGVTQVQLHKHFDLQAVFEAARASLGPAYLRHIQAGR